MQDIQRGRTTRLEPRIMAVLEIMLYVIGTAAYFLYASLYRQPQGAGQQVALINYSAHLPDIPAPATAQ